MESISGVMLPSPSTAIGEVALPLRPLANFASYISFEDLPTHGSSRVRMDAMGQTNTDVNQSRA